MSVMTLHVQLTLVAVDKHTKGDECVGTAPKIQPDIPCKTSNIRSSAPAPLSPHVSEASCSFCSQLAFSH